MFVMIITDDHNEFISCTDNNKEQDININIKYLILLNPANIVLFYIIGLILYTMVELLISNK